MFKNILFILIIIILSAVLTVFAYLWVAPKNSEVLKPFFPKTNFSLEKAPSESLVGNIASFSGNVSWQSRTANFATLINSPINLQQGEELFTQNNGNATISFPDVCQITLSKNTGINLIQTLPANLVVQQRQGKASYEKLGIKTPLSVRAFDLLIDVNSGIINVTVDKDKDTVVLESGTGTATASFVDTDNNTKIFNVKSDETIFFDNNTKTYSAL